MTGKKVYNDEYGQRKGDQDAHQGPSCSGPCAQVPQEDIHRPQEKHQAHGKKYRNSISSNGIALQNGNGAHGQRGDHRGSVNRNFYLIFYGSR